MGLGKIKALSFFLLLNMGLVLTLSAEEPEQPGSVGLGVSIVGFVSGTSTYVLTNYNTITMPILVSESFMIEPIFTYSTSSEKIDESYESVYSEYAESAEVKSHTIGLGSGLYYRQVSTKNTLYFGGQLGVIAVKTEAVYSSDDGDKTKYEISGSGLFTAAVVGSEYLISPYLSLGVECQLKHTQTKEKGERVVSYSGSEYSTDTIEAEVSTNDTYTFIFLRWYF